ncbi:uncharacterized protein LOC131623110 [Vicia villosa]|uniref:uncharacterized protein LOC131623110 n=1 Tax=Vicia villosa TaxID=3911 RepID=UPI00273A9E86|nr:uncharacterized protein LOC131623110 [Vicia villosa]
MELVEGRVQNNSPKLEFHHNPCVEFFCLNYLKEARHSSWNVAAKVNFALAHQECAIKWFSIKGTRTCDVCKKDVRNLAVTLLQIQSVRNRFAGASRSQLEDVNEYMVWQEVPLLVIVSMLTYFCFLEHLLVTKMGTGAFAISLPFFCVLGLLSSMTSSTMGRFARV